ncbi:MAG: helix-turn-helix transcriptional regulator [Sulfurospirillum sp.]|nr:helix-turn-helix transcriptional regulator [Sulfurospirillum sp.]
MDFSELGKEIAMLRKQKKVSQQSLCEDIAISRGTLSNLENGGNIDIGLKKVLQIVDYLGCEVCIKEKSPFPVFEDIING